MGCLRGSHERKTADVLMLLGNMSQAQCYVDDFRPSIKSKLCCMNPDPVIKLIPFWHLNFIALMCSLLQPLRFVGGGRELGFILQWFSF